MARVFRLGPCRLLSSANITDPLATWHDHGWIRGNVLDRYADNYVNTGRADQSGRTPRADAVYVSGSPQAGYTIPLLNYQIDEVLRVFPGAVKVTNSAREAIGISTPASTLTPRAFALVPEADYDEALPGKWWQSDHVRYIEEGILHITESFTYNLPDGDDVLESKAYVCEVMALADADSTQTGGIGLYRTLTYIFKSVGDAPFGAAVTPDGTTAIVANSDSDNITLITLADNSTTTVSVGNNPQGVAVTPDGTTAITANLNSDDVTLVTLADNSTTTVNVGNNPRDVAVTPDGTTAIVANRDSDDVTLITLADNSTTTVNVGSGPHGVAVTPDGTTAIVANRDSDDVTLITLADNSTTTVSVGDGPISVAVTPDGTTAIVTNLSSDNVTLITLANNSTTTVSVGDGPISVAVTPDGTTAIVANLNSDDVTLVTLADNSTTTVNVGNAPRGVAVTPDGTTAIVANRDSDDVTLIVSLNWNAQ